ncbi:MAG: heteromeric transposase endonuclease subunit TnsA [Colwellia sp.]|nr:heteromeric transposase endonuclease subunit TnsA [Colwellia sp.]
MAGKKYCNSEAKNQKWIKDGRGSGTGRDYLPWLTVRDLASKGRSHRIFGHKTQRTHHLLSDLELATFFILEWNKETSDIREQFPLRIEDTLALANEAGIKHPAVQGIDQVMSTDFLVDTNDLARPKFAVQAKFAETLQDPRTVEKLELERRYWKSKSIPWLVITEQEIPRVVFENIRWLYPAQREEIGEQLLFERIDFYLHSLRSNPDRTIIDITRKLDTAYDMDPGESLLEMRQLLAHRYFCFDIFTPFKKIKAHELIVGDIPLLKEALNVPNQ